MAPDVTDATHPATPANRTERAMSTYTEAVDQQLAGLEFVSPGLAAICPECRAAHDYDSEQAFADAYESGELCDEGGFSWSPCDACGSHLGGNRYAAHGFLDSDPDRGKLIHLEICQDCLFYLANGDEPEHWEP